MGDFETGQQALLTLITEQLAIGLLSDVTISAPADKEILTFDSGTSEWINRTAAEAGLSIVGHTHVASDITDFDTEVANNDAVVLNTAKITNATHSGDVSGATVLTIGVGKVKSSMILDDTIVNVDINSGANIAITKLANGTANQIIKTNAGGTALEFGLIADANIASHTSTKITITAKGQLNSAIVYNDQANVFGDFNQTFKDNRILIESPDGLTPVTLINSQQTLARNLTIPILVGNDSIVTLATTQSITGAKTFLADIAFTAADILLNGNLLNLSIITLQEVSNQAVFTIADNTASAGIKIENTDGSFSLSNGTGTTDNFLPTFIGVAKGSTKPGLFFVAEIPVVDDTGTTAVMRFDARRIGPASIVTRPLFQITNSGAVQWEMDVNGNVDMFTNNLNNAVLVTPTIASFINATHDHSNAAGGGNLTNTALTSGVFAAITGIGLQSQDLNINSNSLTNVTNINTIAVTDFARLSIAQTFAAGISFDSFIDLADVDGTPVADRRLTVIDGLIRARTTADVEGRFISRLSLEEITAAEIATNAVSNDEINSHTSTKITITAKGQLNSSLIYGDQNNDFNAFYFDIDNIAVPGNPAANHRRVFVDSIDGVLKVRTPAGTTVSLEAGAAGGNAWSDAVDSDVDFVSTFDIVNLVLLNGFAVTDIARLSQANVFTGAGQQINPTITSKSIEAQALLHLVGDAVTNRRAIIQDVYGGNANWILRHANGTVATPTATTANIGMFINFRPFDGTIFTAASKAFMGFVAGETISPTNQGTSIFFSTTANGGTLTTEKLRITGDGNLVMQGGDLTLGALGAQLIFTGDTFIREVTANKMDFTAGGSIKLEIGASGLELFNGELAIQPTKKFYLDGLLGTGDTFISEAGANVIDIQTGGKNAIQCRGGNGVIQLLVADAVPASANLVANNIAFYIDETANELKVKVKYNDGTTVKIGTVAALA